MHVLQGLFCLTTALHASGATITHLQENKTTVTTASGNRYTILLTAAIVEELEPDWACCGWRTLQEHKTTVTTASGNRYTVLLSAAIVEELEPVWVCCGWCTPPTIHSNWFQLFHDSSSQQYGVTVTRCCSYSCFVLLKMGDSDARNM
jgi:hypothetical protein